MEEYNWHWISVLSFLISVLLADFVMPLEPWDRMLVKHTWQAVLINWESLGHPPAGTRINLDISLKPERENALIDALSEASNPRHPRHILLAIPPLAPLFTSVAAPFQIWRSPEQVAELTTGRTC
jgi:hypothetical protein